MITNSAWALDWQTGISFSQVQLQLSGQINLNNGGDGDAIGYFDLNENVNGFTASLSRGFGNSHSISFRASGFATTENDLNRADISVSYSRPLGGLTTAAGYYFNDTEIVEISLPTRACRLSRQAYLPLCRKPLSILKILQVL